MSESETIEGELDRELRVVASKAIVWVAVAAGIGMAVVRAIRALQARK